MSPNTITYLRYVATNGTEVERRQAQEVLLELGRGKEQEHAETGSGAKSGRVRRQGAE